MPLTGRALPTGHAHMTSQVTPTGRAPTRQSQPYLPITPCRPRPTRQPHPRPTPPVAWGPSWAPEACAAWHTGLRAPLSGALAWTPQLGDGGGSRGVSIGLGAHRLSAQGCSLAARGPEGTLHFYPEGSLWHQAPAQGLCGGRCLRVRALPSAHPSWGPGGPVLRCVALSQAGRGCRSRAVSAPRYSPALTPTARGCGRPERVRCRLHMMAGTEPGPLGARSVGW